MKVAILLLAAGRGTRLGADVPKAWLPLGGEPLLLHSAARLLAALEPTEPRELLLLVQTEDRERFVTPHLERLAGLAGGRDNLKVVDGGSTRQQSMAAGLAATAADADLVLVHDAARALVPIEPVRACLRAAAKVGAALLAVPASDTLKRGAAQRVVATVDRSDIWYAQTPQIARREHFLRAVEYARTTGFDATDDASLLEHAGIDVAIVPGTAGNLKITRPDDLPLAAALLAQHPTPFEDTP